MTRNEAFIILDKYRDALAGTELCQALEVFSADVKRIGSLVVRVERLKDACDDFTSAEETVDDA